MKEKEQPAERFDDEMDKLRSIVERMEQGELPLEESLKLFEQGIGSARKLTEALHRAEGRVEELLETMERASFPKMEE
jgi:exodeoxyribonuclease VII small subunit